MRDRLKSIDKLIAELTEDSKTAFWIHDDIKFFASDEVGGIGLKSLSSIDEEQVIMVFPDEKRITHTSITKDLMLPLDDDIDGTSSSTVPFSTLAD